jgi:hypothetical protein
LWQLSIYVAAGFEVIRKGVAFTEEQEVLRSVLLEELGERRLLILLEVLESLGTSTVDFTGGALRV